MVMLWHASLDSDNGIGDWLTRAVLDVKGPGVHGVDHDWIKMTGEPDLKVLLLCKA